MSRPHLPPALRPGLGAALLGVVVVLYVALGALWLERDDRLPDGDVLGVLGAVELFWARAQEDGALGALAASYTEDFGEYPALGYALTGIATAWAGVTDLDGDGPTRVALGWGVITLLATGWLAVELGRRRGSAVGVGAMAALGLLASPLWFGAARHLLLENIVCAWVTLAGAASLASDRRRSTPLAALSGVLAGAALLSKQTAALALLPIAITVAIASWRTPGARTRLFVATTAAAVVIGPWMLLRVGAQAAYLGAAAQANPGAVGALHQLAIYPLAALQQGWAPAIWGAVLLLGWRARAQDREPRPEVRWALMVVGLGILVLLPIPKRYPRLLLPLLPWAAAALAVHTADWRLAHRRSLVLALGVGALGAWTGGAGWTAPIGPMDLGLTSLDERCLQRWSQPPSQPGLPFAALIAAAEAAGGPRHPYRLGAIDWPAPPCGYQTSHDLGEHLRIRMRRAGSEADVGAGASFQQAGGWGVAGPPDVLLHVGPSPCTSADVPTHAACAGERWVERARVPFDHPEWTLDLRLAVPVSGAP